MEKQLRLITDPQEQSEALNENDASAYEEMTYEEVKASGGFALRDEDKILSQPCQGSPMRSGWSRSSGSGRRRSPCAACWPACRRDAPPEMSPPQQFSGALWDFLYLIFTCSLQGSLSTGSGCVCCHCHAGDARLCLCNFADFRNYCTAATYLSVVKP